jgi:hypothetical protein
LDKFAYINNSQNLKPTKMTEEEKAAQAAAQSSTTAVEEVDFDNLDDLLGIPSASAIIAPAETKHTVLKSDKVDVSFLDNIGDDDTESLKDPEVAKAAVSAIVDAPLNEEEEEDDAGQVNKGGRPKLTKDAMIEAATRLIDKGVLQPFDDGKALADYTVDDFEELIQANIDSQTSEVAQNAPVQLFQQLPEEVQAVIHYALNGGQDIKSVFSQLAKAQETFDLDITNEQDQESIARQYLNVSGFGSVEEIEDEINVLKDRGDLAKYAERYKPKLDAKQAEVIEKRLQDQQAAQVRKNDMEKKYHDVVYNTLNSNNLNGIPLNNKVQTMLYYGLTDASKYQDAKGNPTNALGYLLEQHQFGEKANPSLVAEALWLLADPVNYRNSVKQLGANVANANTVRTLRTEEASRNTSSTGIGEQSTSAGRATTKREPIKRQGKSLFSR